MVPVLKANLLLINFDLCKLTLELPDEALKFFFKGLVLSSLVGFNSDGRGPKSVYQASNLSQHLLAERVDFGVLEPY